MSKKKRRKEEKDKLVCEAIKNFELNDFDDVEIRNLVFKLKGIMENIDDLEYEQEEHESILQSLKEKMKTLEKQRKELEDEITSLT